VLAAVGLLTPLLRLPDACSTMLASDGAPLSETQQRLIGLARAMAGQPGVLLVDSLLDTLSGRELDGILNYLTSTERPWTLVVATSRQDIAERFAKRIDLRTS
jgi:ABC-type phosphate transport system ATPase subunit